MYTLGVDLGTTFVAAAVCRGGRAEVCSLGVRAPVVPSVVLLLEDGSFLSGDAAARRGVLSPLRVAREFKRRIGDSTPLLLAGVPVTAETLTARLLASVVDQVSLAEGGPPDRVCLTRPADWGPFKQERFAEAVAQAHLDVPVTYLAEPVAAAIHYARERELPVGALLAVYDLGGGTFDAAVLRRTEDGFEPAGTPAGIDRLGGVDVDAAVFRHVVQVLGDGAAEWDEDDPATMSAVARLREECTAAKEVLSSDTQVTIPVLLPGLSTSVRLNRAELEAMVRPALDDTVEATRRAIVSAGLTAEDLSAVLLVGGASRMPLVAQIVGAELGRPVVVDAHPKHGVALGAAWAAAELTPAAAPAVTPPLELAAAVAAPPAALPSPAASAILLLPAPAPSAPLPAAPAGPTWEAGPRPDAGPLPPPLPPMPRDAGPLPRRPAPDRGPDRNRARTVAVAAAAVVVVAVGAALWVIQHERSPGRPVAGAPAPASGGPSAGPAAGAASSPAEVPALLTSPGHPSPAGPATSGVTGATTTGSRAAATPSAAATSRTAAGSAAPLQQSATQAPVTSSAPAAVTTSAPPLQVPGAVASVRFTCVTTPGGSISVSWSAAEGATSYDLRVDDNLYRIAKHYESSTTDAIVLTESWAPKSTSFSVAVTPMNAAGKGPILYQGMCTKS